MQSPEPHLQTDRPESQKPSLSTIALLLLLIAGFILRAVLAHRNVYPSYDGTFYLNTARDLVALGKYYRSGFPPGYPLLICPVLFNMDWSVPAAPLIAGQVVNVIAGTLLGLFTYWFARRTFSHTLSVIVAGIALFLPLCLQLSAMDLSGLSFACFLLGGWLLFSSGRMTSAGLVWGYGYLIRPEGLILIVIVACRALAQRRWDVWKLVAAASAMAIPYVVLASLSSNGFTVSQKWVFLERTLHAHPGISLLGLYLDNVTTLIKLLARTVGPLVLGLGIMGLLARPSGWAICLSPLVLLPIFDFRMEDRYLLPYLPFVLVAATNAVYWIIGRLEKDSLRRVISTSIIIAVFATLLLAGYDRRACLRGNLEYYPGLHNAGIWLRDRVTHDTIIAGRKPYVSFWAWCKYERIPEDMQLSEIVDWAERQGCGYLVVHIGVALGMAPALVPLIEGTPSHLVDRIQLVRTFIIPDQPQETTFVYKILRH